MIRCLNTFIVEPDADLAEILFHELAHQRLFIAGDTDFNEAFATAVGARRCSSMVATTIRSFTQKYQKRPRTKKASS